MAAVFPVCPAVLQPSFAASMQSFAVTVYELSHSGFIPAAWRSAAAFRRLCQSAGNTVPSMPESVL
jgi:hypothetical protein